MAGNSLTGRGGSVLRQTMQTLALSQNMPGVTGNAQAPDLCASDQADFAPLYRCLHIYDVLVRPILPLRPAATRSRPRHPR